MTATSPAPASIDDLRARVAVLQARFVEVGTRAARAAADVAAGGTPPSEELLVQLTTMAAEFQALRDDVLESVATLEVVLPQPVDALLSLRDLPPVLDALAATLANTDRHRRHEAGRAAALHVIDRVQAIVHHDEPVFAPLAQCQAAAREMHEEIAGSAATDGDVIGWAARLRPFADLLEMLEGAVDDARFAQLADSVAAAFGPPLATAAMRGRLRLLSLPR
jgi:hypothetical protein